MENPSLPLPIIQDTLTTREVAQYLGLAVRSVQLMVDRGDLQAWKTSGGHRRISRESVTNWLSGTRERAAPDAASTHSTAPVPPTQPQAIAPVRRRSTDSHQPTVVLIEDSAHFQNMIRLLIKHVHPNVHLHVAGDAVLGLALCGAIRPDVLIIDILLPGIDGATLVNSVRSQNLFEGMQLLVVTALDEAERAPYTHALAGVPVIEKQHLTRELPAALAELIAASSVKRH
ncbi:MAG: excisionase family DNA-binding protein [Burkholderiales bacterium]|nr:excisionase family DNA-binding protein [Burkholderiales bacterium]